MQKLFDSRDMYDSAAEIWLFWDEDVYGCPRPRSYNDPLVMQTAYDYSVDDYRYIVDEFAERLKDSRVLLIGYLGLWNGDSLAYKITDSKHALESDQDDLMIAYEDGDIWLHEYHHDGVNSFRVLGLMPFDAVPKKARKFYRMLENNSDITEELVDKYLDLITFSTAPYMKDFMQAPVDMEEQR